MESEWSHESTGFLCVAVDVLALRHVMSAVLMVQRGAAASNAPMQLSTACAL